MHKLLHGSMEECGDVWQYLSGLRRPIVLYGMGDGADKMLRVCKRYDIRIADFFASDDFVRGQCFHDRRVLTFSEILSKYDDFTVVIGFSTARKEVLERLYFLDSRFDVVVPDVPLYGDEVFTLEYLKEHTEEFTRAYELLADEQSRLVYRSVLFSKLTGRLFFMRQAVSENSDIQDLLRLRDVRFYADLGAYRGIPYNRCSAVRLICHEFGLLSRMKKIIRSWKNLPPDKRLKSIHIRLQHGPAVQNCLLRHPETEMRMRSGKKAVRAEEDGGSRE